MARTALLQIGTRPICRLHKASGQTLVQIKGRPFTWANTALHKASSAIVG
jgi:hypothetical protein